MGVWSTTFIYLPHDGKPLSERIEDARQLVEAAGVQIFTNTLIGQATYDMFCDNTELERLDNASYSSIVDAVAKHEDAAWFSATDDGERPVLVDEINCWMKDHADVAGDYTLFMFGLVVGEAAIEDEYGEPLFQSSLMIQFDASGSPPDNQGYAQQVLASKPVQDLLEKISNTAEPSTWKSVMVVS